MTTHTTDPSMDQLLQASPQIVSIEPGTVVAGRVIGIERGIIVDIGGVFTGFISGKELNDPMGTAKKLNIGDEVRAFVLEDDKNGMVVLSIRKAAQLEAWDYFEKIKTEGGTFEVVAKSANKGGLMCEVMGITAFLPVSQLAPANYPRVNNADSEAILAKLEQLVGRKFTVRPILIQQDIHKLVVSEREAFAEMRQKSMEKLQIGDIVDGKVNGLVKFGAFIVFGAADELEGLAHISELTWSHVKNPTELFKEGDEVQAQVLSIEGNKISLSLKRLTPDPWLDKIEPYTENSVHQGVVNKVTNFGVFVTLEDDVTGLIHTSEFLDEKANPEETFSEGQEVQVRVLEVLKNDRSLRLSLKGIEGTEEKKAAPKKKKSPEKISEEKEPKKKSAPKKAKNNETEATAS